jgi:hypothetical protein
MTAETAQAEIENVIKKNWGRLEHAAAVAKLAEAASGLLRVILCPPTFRASAAASSASESRTSNATTRE